MATFQERPRLLLSAFLMNTSSHILGGMWRHPEAQQHRFNELSLWVDLAKKLEDAKFDALFFADVVGLYGDHEGGWASHVRKGPQVPSHDPLVLLSALAAGTKDIGLAMTSSVIQSHPFQFARQISTLDHLSQGRVAWNIVTSVLENAHRNFGGQDLVAHDDRYGWAEEYVEAAYKLWEGSWEDDALLADKESGLYADPSKVNKINHRGDFYSIDGPHLALPSAQRTPFLFQAGSSARGSQFAATHAEATFLFAPHAQYVAKKNAQPDRKSRRRWPQPRRYQGLRRAVLCRGIHRSRSQGAGSRIRRVPGFGGNRCPHRRWPGRGSWRFGPGYALGTNPN
ncbi:NtaA/DmoA family FMN-dependent monooxygenase [Glutamicibacter halophytocola]|uniref:NtaA/DmoA family FMN-dependent monooxygenase n=1 Tax=Glutamicibacter halophytocola TaxID=1933880 RepID=UPI003D2C6C0A